jgi:hypothetical protein
MLEVQVMGLTPELDALASPISTAVANLVRGNLREMMSPQVKTAVDKVLKKRTPTDITGFFGKT